jgi:hypothetical protein
LCVVCVQLLPVVIPDTKYKDWTGTHFACIASAACRTCFHFVCPHHSLQAQLTKYNVAPAQIGATEFAVQSTITGGVSPEMFWKERQQHAPELAKVALMVLTIPPASASSERVFSAVGRIWDTSRTRLATQRVRKMLYIYFNRRALLRDGAVRSADDFAAFQEWLESMPDEEEQQQQQVPIVLDAADG